MKFCVYEHWRPDVASCFYVGKGTQKRARYLSRKRENTRHARIVTKLRKSGLSVEVRFVAIDIDEAKAFEIERERIAFWRSAGVDLANMTDGGEGAAGAVRTEEFKATVSKALKGRNDWTAGRRLTEEHRSAIATSLKGRTLSEETRQKISLSQKGKPRPELVGRKLSEDGLRRLRERVFSEEHKRRISESKKGKPKSPEHRLKMAAAARATHARKKLEKLEGAPE